MGEYRFEIVQRRNWRLKKYWFVRFVAPNGQTMNSTETFTSITAAQSNALSVKENAGDASIVVVIE